MRMSWSSQLHFGILATALFQTSQETKVNEKVLPFSDRTTCNGFSVQGLKCAWRCKVNGSDLNTRIKRAFTEKKILISLSFDYLETVDKKCASHVLYNTHNEDIEQLWHSSDWQIWMVNNKFPSFANNAATRSLLSLFDLSPVFYKQLAAEHS